MIIDSPYLLISAPSKHSTEYLYMLITADIRYSLACVETRGLEPLTAGLQGQCSTVELDPLDAPGITCTRERSRTYTFCLTRSEQEDNISTSTQLGRLSTVVPKHSTYQLGRELRV